MECTVYGCLQTIKVARKVDGVSTGDSTKTNRKKFLFDSSMYLKLECDDKAYVVCLS